MLVQNLGITFHSTSNNPLQWQVSVVNELKLFLFSTKYESWFICFAKILTQNDNMTLGDGAFLGHFHGLSVWRMSEGQGWVTWRWGFCAWLCFGMVWLGASEAALVCQCGLWCLDWLVSVCSWGVELFHCLLGSPGHLMLWCPLGVGRWYVSGWSHHLEHFPNLFFFLDDQSPNMIEFSSWK